MTTKQDSAEHEAMHCADVATDVAAKVERFNATLRAHYQQLVRVVEAMGMYTYQCPTCGHSEVLEAEGTPSCEHCHVPMIVRKGDRP